jgi:hypothetical protein
MQNTLTASTFEVVEVPIKYEGLANAEDYKFIVNAKTCEVISCMTKDYRLVSNQEVMDKSLPHIEEKGGVLTECKTFGNGARTSWTFQFKEHPVTIQNEILYPQLNIRNSYDGTSVVAILGGVFRLICSNGAIIGKIFKSHSERHTMWNSHLSNGHISNMITNTIDSMDKVFTNEFPVLFNTKTKEKDVVKVIEKLPSQYTEDAVNYILTHKPNTYWDLFNLCTWILTHRANRSHETTHKLESEVYHFIKKMATA